MLDSQFECGVFRRIGRLSNVHQYGCVTNGLVVSERAKDGIGLVLAGTLGCCIGTGKSGKIVLK